MKSRSARKQKRQRTRKHKRRQKQRGGGNTFNRNIHSDAVITNPIFDMKREEVSEV